MNSAIQLFLLILFIVIISTIIYKLGFRLTDIKIKTWLLEFIMKRDPNQRKQKMTEPNSDKAHKIPHVTAIQKAANGGEIKRSTIKADKNSNANLKEEAIGENSKITDSHIEIK